MSEDYVYDIYTALLIGLLAGAGVILILVRSLLSRVTVDRRAQYNILDWSRPLEALL